MKVVYPKPLAPGDGVFVVAPSSGFPLDDFWRGLAWLRSRYRLVMRSDVLAKDGYLAGTDERRARELTRAMTAPDVAAIVCARGGYGAMRIVDALPWDELAQRPRWCAASATSPRFTWSSRGGASPASTAPT